jgi:hypothetical protein
MEPHTNKRNRYGGDRGAGGGFGGSRGGGYGGGGMGGDRMNNLGVGLKTQQWDMATLPKFEKSFCMFDPTASFSIDNTTLTDLQTRSLPPSPTAPPRRLRLSVPRSRCASLELTFPSPSSPSTRLVSPVCFPPVDHQLVRKLTFTRRLRYERG